MVNHMAILGTGGTLYVSGSNFNGQLGLGSFGVVHLRPTKARNVPQFSSVTTTRDITCAVSKEDGSIWWCGNKITLPDNQLPTGNWSFTRMPDTIDFVSVSLGKDFLIGLDCHGKVWGLGSNMLGQLGLDTLQNTQKKLIKNPYLSDITSVAAAGLYSLTLDVNGVVRTSGDNSSGQLGLPTLKDGGLDEFLVHTAITLKSPAIKIATGERHSLVLDQDFIVWGFGLNRHGELGLGDCKKSPIKKVPIPFDSVDIACGNHSSYITDIDGNVWVMGSNTGGQLALAEESAGLAETCENDRESARSRTMENARVDCVRSPQINPHLYQKKLYPSHDSLLVVDAEGFLYGCGSNVFGKPLPAGHLCIFKLVRIYRKNVF